MKTLERFIGRKIFFFGDSITADGRFFNYLRAFCVAKGIDIAFYNKGIAGYRADLLPIVLNEELSGEIPDFAVLSYGVNDLGVWLYDGRKTLTAEIIAERENRIKNYFSATERNVFALRERGITPIVASPFCVNDGIEEKAGIVTAVDNNEKDVIDNGFYTRKTFRSINEGLNEMRVGLETLAKKLNAEFWDLFAYTNEYACGECFIKDGLHYSQEGNFLIANAVFGCMCGASIERLPTSAGLISLYEKEADERAYFFEKYNEAYFDTGRILSDWELKSRLHEKSELFSDNDRYKRCLNYLSDKKDNRGDRK